VDESISYTFVANCYRIRRRVLFKKCPVMTGGKDWVYKCMNHNKLNLDWCAIDYSLHTLDSTMVLLNNPAYFSDREYSRIYIIIIENCLIHYNIGMGLLNV
jgi:hypothetical protein